MAGGIIFDRLCMPRLLRIVADFRVAFGVLGTIGGSQGARGVNENLDEDIPVLGPAWEQCQSSFSEIRGRELSSRDNVRHWKGHTYRYHWRRQSEPHSACTSSNGQVQPRQGKGPGTKKISAAVGVLLAVDDGSELGVFVL